MYKPRQKQLQEWLTKNNLDAFLVNHPENIRWLTGFNGSFGMYWQGKNEGALISDGRYSVIGKDVASKAGVHFIEYTADFSDRFAGLQRGNIGGEKSMTLARYDQVQKLFGQASLHPKDNVIESLRRVKDKQERQKIQTAQAHVDQVLFPFLQEQLKQGVTEQQVEYRLRQVLSKEGMYGLSFDPIVAFGANAALPHHHPKETKLVSGSCVLVDCGVTYDGYASDMTRNAYFGDVDPEYKAWYQDLLSIQEASLSKCTPGMDVADIDQWVRDQMGDRVQYYTHSLGHGVGLNVHESPGISMKSKDQFIENEVITIEPGWYKEGHFGIRIEDIGCVTNQGLEVYSKTPKDLLVIS